MSKRIAERLVEYRHLKDESGGLERLSMMVAVRTKRQLERLASYHGLTKRAMLERILAEAERVTVDALPAEAHGDYYAQRSTSRGEDPASP